MNISISRDGVEIGEWTEEDVRALYAQGQLLATDFYWKEGMAEWKELGTLMKPPPPPGVTPRPQVAAPLQKHADVTRNPGQAIPQPIIHIETKQGAVIGGWICFCIGILLMFLSVWSFVIYAPLFLVAFILSIVAMAQKRIVGGLLLLFCCLIVAPGLFFYLSMTRTTKTLQHYDEQLRRQNNSLFAPQTLAENNAPTPMPQPITVNTNLWQHPSEKVNPPVAPEMPLVSQGKDATNRDTNEEGAHLAASLKNGVLIDNDLSVAVVKCEPHLVDRSAKQGTFTTDVDGAEMTLAFRRVSTQWYKTPSGGVSGREFQVIVIDDRGNEYPALHRYARSQVLYNSSFSLDDGMYGTPSKVGEMPVGFTWTGKVKVQMPPGAPISKVELERKRYGRLLEQPVTQRFPMGIADATAPDFEFDIPSQLSLSEGSSIEEDRDVSVKIGHLTVLNTYTTREYGWYGPEKTMKGLSLLLPIEATNVDYNPHKATVPQLSVQFEDGEVIRKSDDRVMQSAQLPGNPNMPRISIQLEDGKLIRKSEVSPIFLSDSEDFEVPGKSVRILTLRVDVAESMNAEVGFNVRRILLYGKGGFRGFVRIPDDARQRIAEIAGKGSARGIGEESGQVIAPTMSPSVSLSGTGGSPLSTNNIPGAPGLQVPAPVAPSPSPVLSDHDYHGTTETNFAKNWVVVDGVKLDSIISVIPATGAQVAILYSGGGKDVSANKLPQGFLDVWKITPQALQAADSQSTTLR